MCGFPLFMLEYVIVCWVYDMRIFFSLAYPMLVCMIVCGFLLCDDHQSYWCEHMWEPLAVVTIIEMLQLDESWTSIELALGAHSYWSFSSLSFSRSWRDFVPCFRPCGASSFCYEYVWGTVYVISQIFVLFGYLYICDILLNWFYLFNWDVTIISKIKKKWHHFCYI